MTETTDNGIEIEYLLKMNDYLEAYALYESKTALRKIDKLVSIVLIFLGIILLSLTFIGGFKISGLVCSIMLIIVGVFDFLGFIDFGKIIEKKRFKNNEKLKFIQKIRFIETGLEYETNGIKSTIEWSVYKKYYEGENVFLLVYGNRQYSVSKRQIIGHIASST